MIQWVDEACRSWGAIGFKHYVYALIDPKTDRPFYIGKGHGRRCLHHFTKRSLAKDCLKNTVILYRRDYEKLEIPIRFLGWFKDEAAAFDFEAELIISAPTRSLANYNDGRGHKKYEHLRPDIHDLSMELRP